jgi:hypothetical protein
MNKSLSGLKNRIPYWQDTIYVFSGVIFIIYSWSVRGFLYQLPSLILYHRILDIISVLFYLMAFALLESLVVMSGLILLGFILPRKWFVEGFAYKGFLTAFVAGISMISLQGYLYSLNYETPSMNIVYLGLFVTLVALVGLILLFQKLSKLQKILLIVEEQLQIFIYLYIPLGIAGLMVIFFRNL